MIQGFVLGNLMRAGAVGGKCVMRKTPWMWMFVWDVTK